jgi:hypothetical protein
MGTPDWLSAVCRVPCTVYNRVKQPDKDEYNNDVYVDEPTPATCFLQPASADEIQDGRAEIGTWLMHFGAEYATLLDGFARIDVYGQSFEAAGPPQVYIDIDSPPFGALPVHHVELMVTRSTA